MKKSLWILAILLVVLSCRKDTGTTTDLGFNYYPESVNSYKVYQVDSFVFNDFTHTIDTFQYYIKDIVESEFVDDGNRKVKRVERYKSQDKTKWEIQKVWTFYKNSFQVEEQVDNIRYIKLNFPVEINKSWNGNAANVMDKENYNYGSKTIDTNISGFSLARTMKVEHFYITDPLQINTEIRYEHYTPDIGLVNRYEKMVKRFTTGVPGDPVVDSGYVLSMRINEYHLE
ncbi:MAG: hypothetical protein CL840_18010 [Crocinitomicaceae bacterium]|nr:hypothetical protein [Crocinitomicaceae bacterium]|tara:strand:+ start:27736 stop:28422 length:687 start_codon:yes stop_codon:yes gene_type:complete